MGRGSFVSGFLAEKGDVGYLRRHLFVCFLFFSLIASPVYAETEDKKQPNLSNIYLAEPMAFRAIPSIDPNMPSGVSLETQGFLNLAVANQDLKETLVPRGTSINLRVVSSTGETDASGMASANDLGRIELVLPETTVFGEKTEKRFSLFSYPFSANVQAPASIDEGYEFCASLQGPNLNILRCVPLPSTAIYITEEKSPMPESKIVFRSSKLLLSDREGLLEPTLVLNGEVEAVFPPDVNVPTSAIVGIYASDSTQKIVTHAWTEAVLSKVSTTWAPNPAYVPPDESEFEGPDVGTSEPTEYVPPSLQFLIGTYSFNAIVEELGEPFTKIHALAESSWLVAKGAEMSILADANDDGWVDEYDDRDKDGAIDDSDRRLVTGGR